MTRKPVDRAEVFAALCSVNVACLAVENLADKVAAGKHDIEGELTDVLLHLRAVWEKLCLATD